MTEKLSILSIASENDKHDIVSEKGIHKIILCWFIKSLIILWYCDHDLSLVGWLESTAVDPNLISSVSRSVC